MGSLPLSLTSHNVRVPLLSPERMTSDVGQHAHAVTWLLCPGNEVMKSRDGLHNFTLLSFEHVMMTPFSFQMSMSLIRDG